MTFIPTYLKQSHDNALCVEVYGNVQRERERERDRSNQVVTKFIPCSYSRVGCFRYGFFYGKLADEINLLTNIFKK
jgi:hypothetical protein